MKRRCMPPAGSPAALQREGRPTQTAILTARLTDRPLRPLFPKGYRNEVQVIITTLSIDMINDPWPAVDYRRVGGAGDLGYPVRWPGRRGAGRPPRRQRDDQSRDGRHGQ
jgi:hypothetical protein